MNLVTALVDSLHGALSARRTPSATVAVRRANEDVEVAYANAGPSTLFEIGSITKVMTATLVLQHVQQGHTNECTSGLVANQRTTRAGALARDAPPSNANASAARTETRGAATAAQESST